MKPTRSKAIVISHSSSSWTMSLTDLAALLLCLFVLAFAFRSLAPEQWATVREGFRSGFVGEAIAAKPTTHVTQNSRGAIAAQRLADALARQGLASDVAVEPTAQGVQLDLSWPAVTNEAVTRLIAQSAHQNQASIAVRLPLQGQPQYAGLEQVLVDQLTGQGLAKPTLTFEERRFAVSVELLLPDAIGL
jgi:flagellar motor protein MotB